MVALALGPMPGTSMSLAADVMMGEMGHFPALPELPSRGLGSDEVGRTAGLLEALNVERGPRSWRLSARPQLLTRRTWDRLDRDLDEIAAVWGESVPRIKVQAMGPYSLAASIELGNGHRALTDRGALEDITQSLAEGIAQHAQDVSRRFGAEVSVQLNEPLLQQIVHGKIPGTTDFDTIAAVPEEVVQERLSLFAADFLHSAPFWQAARSARTLLTPLAGIDSPHNLDGLGEHLSAGRRIGFGIAGREPRGEAISIAQLFDLMGMPRDLLINAVDVYPLKSTPETLRAAVQTAEILQADAGDL